MLTQRRLPLVLPSFPHVEARALNIKRTLGTLRAAAYLREQGVSEDVARRILLASTSHSH